MMDRLKELKSVGDDGDPLRVEEPERGLRLWAVEEIERLKSIEEKLQAGNRAEALELARQVYREGRYDGTITGAAILKQWPWLKEVE